MTREDGFTFGIMLVEVWGIDNTSSVVLQRPCYFFIFLYF